MGKNTIPQNQLSNNLYIFNFVYQSNSRELKVSLIIKPYFTAQALSPLEIIYIY